MIHQRAIVPANKRDARASDHKLVASVGEYAVPCGYTRIASENCSLTRNYNRGADSDGVLQLRKKITEENLLKFTLAPP